MNNNSINTALKSQNIWKQLFIGLMGLQALLELGVGGTLLFSLQTALETGFGISYNSELEILGMALGLYLLLLTTLIILSIFWTAKSNQAGITLGIIVGVFLFTFGVLSYIRFGDIQAVLIDSIRGLLTVIFAFMARKELRSN